MNRRLRLVPGMTPAAMRDEASLELDALETEARQHVAHLRLLAQQLRLWDDPEHSARALNRIADRYARKFDHGEAA